VQCVELPFKKIPKIKKLPMVIKQNLGPNLNKGDK
jgi:hypothetical protein